MGRAVPAPFLTKTYRMVEDRETDDMISWGQDGASFVVWKPVEFASELLPVHFKHNRFSSFIRQLNTYGFRKVMSDRWEFANEKFRRGEEVLLSEIQRRRRPIDHSSSSAAQPPPLPPSTRPATTSATTDTPDTTPTSSSTSPQSPPVSKLTDLCTENTKLRQEKQTLTMEIARTKKMCEDMLASLSKYVDTNGMNMQNLMNECPLDSPEEMSDSTVPNAAVEEVKEQSIKLFGTLLKVSAQNMCIKDRKRKRVNAGDLCCSASERPVKIAPWIIPSSISFHPGSNKVPN